MARISAVRLSDGGRRVRWIEQASLDSPRRAREATVVASSRQPSG